MLLTQGLSYSNSWAHGVASYNMLSVLSVPAVSSIISLFMKLETLLNFFLREHLPLSGELPGASALHLEPVVLIRIYFAKEGNVWNKKKWLFF